MRIKHIILNLLPLPLWIGYYLITISNKELFMMPPDDNFSFMVIIAFTMYNLFSHNIIEFLARNLVSITSFMAGIFISGQIYLKLYPHMSDEHYSVKAISFDIAIGALVITAVACVISFFVKKRKKPKSINCTSCIKRRFNSLYGEKDMNNNFRDRLKLAHDYCINHKTELKKDKICGCFYCFKIFNPNEIEEWIDDSKGTALCPYCGIDSVIGESSGFPITEDFLKEMHDRWF